MKYAEILLDQKIGESEVLTYSFDEELQLQPGDIVKVQLRNKYKIGLVWKTTSQKPEFRTKKVVEKIYQHPLLSKTQLELISWMSQNYFCPLSKIIKSFIPSNIFKNTKQRATKESSVQINRSKKLESTDEQSKIIEEIINSPKNQFLVQGVTGSGKTEVYLKLAKSYLEKNQQVIILVPEISLTPQTINYFQKSLGIKAEILNSSITPAKKRRSWEGIASEESKLIIGSRSAVFAPVKNLGLIVIDEEHDNSYKQDNSPRYKVHEVIEQIIKHSPQTKAVYGSATPSIETCEKLKDTTLKLTKRINNTSMPDVKIVDLREEFKKKNYSIFSEELEAEISKCLEEKSQIILFINRRGQASSVVCRDCGFKETCKDCESPLTYHAKTLQTPSLICHQCGLISQPKASCPECKGSNIRFLGIGTQRIEEEVKKHFPQARVLRADKDSTSKKNAFEEIYKSFKKHEADILIGTQMIAKGLHLPKVKLVGVILADIGLNIPDFHSLENNFQLLTQVAGRAGRAKERGKVIIQSYNPENYALLCAKEHDFEKFKVYERKQRQLLKNPPFSELCKITVEEDTMLKAVQFAEELENKIWHIAREAGLTENIDVQSYPAYFARFKGKSRHIVLIKILNSAISIQELLEKVLKNSIMAANIKIDPHPISVN